MVKDNRFFTVSRRISHHSVYSGYHQLVHQVGAPVHVPRLLYKLRGTGPLHRYLMRRSGMQWYDGFYLELLTSLHMRRHQSCVYHFLFGERDFRYLPVFQPNRNHKIICTFHATPAEFHQVMKHTKHLEHLDAAIVVSTNQIGYLAPILGKEKVVYIPHSTDTNHFVPPQTRPQGKTCICVGHHHRDFATLGKVASILKDQDPEIRLIVIDRVFRYYLTPEQQRLYTKAFDAAGNVDLRVDLPEEELLQLYQTSDLMVLPLLDTTANVAVLEAMSCGLPLVLSDVGGIRDYVPPDTAAFAAPQDAETMAAHVMRLLRDREEREALSQRSRQNVLRFDWRVIADQVQQLYIKVAGES